jgi:hypothetical protein
MTMRKYIPLMLGLLLVIHAQAFAQTVTKTGTTSAGFLAIDVGPRAIGMGSAYVSVANDATAMYWNPAGIAGLESFQAIFTNSKWIEDLSFNYAGAVLAFGDFGNVGVNATFLTMDPIERTTILNPDGTGEFFDAGSYAVGLSYARQLTDRFSIGVNAKYINERLYHSAASGVALDVGALYHTQFKGLTLGMSISNYGTKMKLDGRDLQIQYDADQSVAGNNPNINARLQTDRFDLPLTFRFGVSFDALKGAYDSNLLLSVDALHPSDDLEYVNIGGEYVFHDMFFLRGGYKELFAKDSEQGLSLGGGLRYSFAGTTTFKLDYSYDDFGVFDAIHTYSVGLFINKK